MGWETRPGRARYYTRSHKRGGKVIREYVGGGAVGELAAAADALRRAQRRAGREARRDEQARWRAALGLLLELSDGTGLLVKATLLPAGFYQHGRSSWRRRGHVRNNDGTPES
jgi:hypothetical protein